MYETIILTYNNKFKEGLRHNKYIQINYLILVLYLSSENFDGMLLFDCIRPNISSYV
jgi:hypothetical protein